MLESLVCFFDKLQTYMNVVENFQQRCGTCAAAVHAEPVHALVMATTELCRPPQVMLPTAQPQHALCRAIMHQQHVPP